MSSIFEEIWNEGRIEGKTEMARELAKLGISVNTIAKVANVDLATVNEWLAQESSMIE